LKNLNYIFLSHYHLVRLSCSNF